MGTNCGPMEADMMACGKTIKQMVKENLYMLMETFMKVNGKMTKLMEKAPIRMQMELTIMVTGLMTNNMDMEKNLGLMVLNMKENI